MYRYDLGECTLAFEVMHCCTLLKEIICILFYILYFRCIDRLLQMEWD